MLPPIPRPEDYDISLKTGFVPPTIPLLRLPDQYYSPWETVVSDLPFLIMTRQVQTVVNGGGAYKQMPVLSVDRLKTVEEQRRAYSILGFIAHGYIWTSTPPADHLPEQIAQPLLRLSDILEVPPVATYAGLCLWNHRSLFGDDIDPSQLDLSSLATLHTFTGSIDESWFYLVSTAIEIQGAACLRHLLSAMQSCRDDSPHDVVMNLQNLAQSIDSLIPTLARFPEQCDPHTFYFRIRPFLAGSENMADAGLPYGVKYGSEDHYRQYAGGSNAQSSLIQALDIALGVSHKPTSGSGGDGKNFIHEMRKYMPGPHRRFLQDLEFVANIREYVLTHKDFSSALTLAYDACLAVLRAFRDKHIQIVSRYIILQAKKNNVNNAAVRKTASQPTSTVKDGLAAVGIADKKPVRGTGGSALIPFLKQARDETGEPAAGSWATRLLRDGGHISSPISPKDVSSFDGSVGLAGKWSVGDDYGGICHW
ncbi:Indoleamine 2,3-dioxygenase [Dipodascopsis uninucleata]